jgi:hypothetical protein
MEKGMTPIAGAALAPGDQGEVELLTARGIRWVWRVRFEMIAVGVAPRVIVGLENLLQIQRSCLRVLAKRPKNVEFV